VDGQLGSDLEHLERGAGAEDVVDHDHGRSVHDADAHRCGGALGESLGVDDRAPAQLVEVEVGVPEMEQARAELVLLGIAILLDEAVRLQRLKQSVDGRPGDVETLGQLADTQAPRPAGEGPEDPRRAIDRLDRPPLPLPRRPIG
jgi:hypothetical protein